jgi:hypothetical protein
MKTEFVAWGPRTRPTLGELVDELADDFPLDEDAEREIDSPQELSF